MSVPGRTKAYNEDLRWCMVWQRLINSYTIKEIASNLYVAESTIWRVVDRFERTGTVTPNRATSRALRLHEHDELLLIELVCDMPSIYLREIQATLFETTAQRKGRRMSDWYTLCMHRIPWQPCSYVYVRILVTS